MSQEQRYASYVSGGFKSVQGWCYHDAFTILGFVDDWQRRTGVQGAVGELGVFKGCFFIGIALCANPEEKILAIDIFGEAAATEGSAPESADYGNPKEEFLRNVREHAGVEIAERTEVVTTDSIDLSPDDVLRYAAGPLRLFSLDGSHTAPSVEHDLRILAPTLAPGGALILDDVFNAYTPGVAEGVVRAMASGERPAVAPVLIGTDANKVVVTTPDAAEQLREALATALTEQGRELRTRTFFGHPTLIVPGPVRSRGAIGRFGRRLKHLVRRR